MLKSIVAKLANMRKPQEFIVYPRANAEAPIMVQSVRCIGQFDPLTGAGRINYKGSGTKYGAHLYLQGAEPYIFPADFVAEAKRIGEIGVTVNLTP